MSQAQYLAIHVGPYHTRFRTFREGDVLADDPAREWETVVDTPKSPARFTELVKTMLSEYGRPFGAIAVSAPGVVDEQTGVGLVSPNLPWLEQFRLGDLLAREGQGAKIVIMQEVRALALGHAATTDDRDFLLVDFGTGMGSAIVLDGALIKSAIPVSGEIGHFQAPDCEKRCGCGSIGCVETLMSRMALINDLSALSGKKVELWTQLDAHVGEHGVEPWLEKRLVAAGRAIASSLNTIGVPKVIVTGSLVQLPSIVIATLADATRRHALAARYRQIDVVAGQRQRLAGLRAALAR